MLLVLVVGLVCSVPVIMDENGKPFNLKNRPHNTGLDEPAIHRHLKSSLMRMYEKVSATEDGYGGVSESQKVRDFFSGKTPVETAEEEPESEEPQIAPDVEQLTFADVYKTQQKSDNNIAHANHTRSGPLLKDPEDSPPESEYLLNIFKKIDHKNTTATANSNETHHRHHHHHHHHHKHDNQQQNATTTPPVKGEGVVFLELEQGSRNHHHEEQQLAPPAEEGVRNWKNPEDIDWTSSKILDSVSKDEEMMSHLSSRIVGRTGLDITRVAELGAGASGFGDMTNPQANVQLQNLARPTAPGAGAIIGSMLGPMMKSMAGIQGSMTAMNTFFDRIKTLSPQKVKQEDISKDVADKVLLDKFKRVAAFANDPLGGQGGDGYFNFGDNAESDCNSYLDQYLSQCNHQTPQLVGMLQTAIISRPISPNLRKNLLRGEHFVDEHQNGEHHHHHHHHDGTRPSVPDEDAGGMFGGWVMPILDIIAWIILKMSKGKGEAAREAFKKFRMQMQEETIVPHRITLGSVNDKTDWYFQQAVMGETLGAVPKLPDSYDPFGPAGPEPGSMPAGENNKWCHDMAASWIKRCILPEQL
eukprot:c8069_g1_i1.p1 GENE.c8069_g1_i1~~c8069_g1_i1.p1  ORF type:complete len:585 (-),score=173.23 c8069_g1_i1:33-1787(-)